MPSSPSTPRLLQRIPTFSETQTDFAQDNETIRKCFAHPHGTRCTQSLQPERQSKAMSLMEKDAVQLDRAEVLSIITLLICEACQRAYRYDYKNRIVEKWQLELLCLNSMTTNDEWREDPYSLARIRTPSSTSRRTSAAVSRRSDITPSLSQQSTHSESPLDTSRLSPTPAPRRPHRTPSGTASTAMRPHLRPSLDTQQSVQMSEQVEVDPQELADGLEPLAIAQAAGRPLREPPTIGPPANLRPDQDEPMADADEPMADADEPMADEEEPLQDRPSTPAEPGTSSSFYPGDASKWSPRMIVDNVEIILTSEVPPVNRGAIYAFQQSHGPHVKIGYSTQSSAVARRQQIQRESNVTLDETVFHWVPNIEMRLLLRLEKLIHADLAYVQRKIKTRDGRGVRTIHHEWFEIDFKTAKQCIDFWYIVVHSQAQLAEVDRTVSKACFDHSDEHSRLRINNDHTCRLTFWRKYIIIPQKHDFNSYVTWLMGCAVIALIPLFLRIPERFAQACVVLGIGIWTQQQFQPSRKQV